MAFAVLINYVISSYIVISTDYMNNYVNIVSSAADS